MTQLDHIPEVLRLEALAAGLGETDVLFRWAKYTAWHASAYGEEADYRLVDWRRHIAWEVAAQEERVKPLSDAAQRARKERREAELMAEAERHEYDALAVTLPRWLADLRRRVDQWDPTVTDHERDFVRWAAEQRVPVLGLSSLWAYGEERRITRSRTFRSRAP